MTAPVGASEVASLLTTREACVVDAPEEDNAAGGASKYGRWNGKYKWHGYQILISGTSEFKSIFSHDLLPTHFSVRAVFVYLLIPHRYLRT